MLEWIGQEVLTQRADEVLSCHSHPTVEVSILKIIRVQSLAIREQSLYTANRP